MILDPSRHLNQVETHRHFQHAEPEHLRQHDRHWWCTDNIEEFEAGMGGLLAWRCPIAVKKY